MSTCVPPSLTGTFTASNMLFEDPISIRARVWADGQSMGDGGDSTATHKVSSTHLLAPPHKADTEPTPPAVGLHACCTTLLVFSSILNLVGGAGHFSGVS
ncbi:unnamed protein product [Protopolystoma xenopodis]|uniref:Uncharacterized protein n=1 Tax=Protopolystoma xenopodis TaxID=117903 RepID=A0A448WVH7_9PLAT|nr:unnamed protein product [Protopolystoma xenopodis]